MAPDCFVGLQESRSGMRHGKSLFWLPDGGRGHSSIAMMPSPSGRCKLDTSNYRPFGG